ncbi:unnamed protein product [Amoebophrya sp. A120]|nr:unnamed protein product [Amoebophrya sp. A120]|eukprot:GSA120T00019272001.1
MQTKENKGEETTAEADDALSPATKLQDKPDEQIRNKPENNHQNFLPPLPSKRYRPYVIFHLHQIKLFDGLEIKQLEVQEARNRFQGKLSMEMLEEKLGPSPACFYVRTINLESSKLKNLGKNLLTDEMFPSLRELILDDNPIGGLDGIGPLGKLVILNCSKCKIGDVRKLLGGGTSAVGGTTSAVQNSSNPLALGGPARGPQGQLQGLASNQQKQMGEQKGLLSIPNLQVLELKQNNIVDLSAITFPALKSLRYLNLEQNELRIFSNKPFSQLENLRDLNLDKNKLRVLEEEDLFGLVNLRELRCEDNLIKSVKLNVFVVPKLRRILLGNNRISDVSLDVILSEKDPNLMINDATSSGANNQQNNQQAGGTSFNNRRGSMPELISSQSQAAGPSGAGGAAGAASTNLQRLYPSNIQPANTNGLTRHEGNGGSSGLPVEMVSILQLSFANNACTRKPLYRATLLTRFPNLRILDSLQLLDENNRPLAETRPLKQSTSEQFAGYNLQMQKMQQGGGGAAGMTQMGAMGGAMGTNNNPAASMGMQQVVHQPPTTPPGFTNNNPSGQTPPHQSGDVGNPSGGIIDPNQPPMQSPNQRMRVQQMQQQIMQNQQYNSSLGGMNAQVQQLQQGQQIITRTTAARVVGENQRAPLPSQNMNKGGFLPGTTAATGPPQNMDRRATIHGTGTTTAHQSSNRHQNAVANSVNYALWQQQHPNSMNRNASDYNQNTSNYEPLHPGPMNQATYFAQQAQQYSQQAASAQMNAMMYYQAAVMAQYKNMNAAAGNLQQNPNRPKTPIERAREAAAAANNSSSAAAVNVANSGQSASGSVSGAFLVTSKGVEQVDKKKMNTTTK